MHKIEISQTGKIHTYYIPASWDELSKSQLLKWAGILRMELNVNEALSLAVYLFSTIPVKTYKKLTGVQELELIQQLDFLQENHLTKNIIGHVSVLGFKFYGPSSRLSNITISEYRRTELYYELYRKSGKKQFLFLLAATLFRPSGKYYDHDIRCKLTEKVVNRYAKLFSLAMHPNCIVGIKLFYEGCRNYIINQHPKVYKKAPKSNQLFKQKTSLITDLEDHILAFSGDKLGNFNETSETNLYVFLKYMTQRMEEFERLERKK